MYKYIYEIIACNLQHIILF